MRISSPERDFPPRLGVNIVRMSGLGLMQSARLLAQRVASNIPQRLSYDHSGMKPTRAIH